MLDLATISASDELLPRKWTLRVFGAFRLDDPSNIECRLANRKVEALVAVLALTRRFGIARDEMCEILWPDRPLENQRANLRQALANLRKSLGEEAIESSRSHIRLSSEFNLECDYDLPGLRKPGGFMPGHEGEWFEELRSETFLTVEHDEPEFSESMVGRFTENLHSLGQIDQRGMFAMLRSNLSTGKGIPFDQLLRLVRSSTGAKTSPGWVDFWLGTLEDDLMICSDHLRRALKEAKRVGDLDLASETCLELGKVYSRLGNLEKAMRMCEIADSVANLAKSDRTRANALRLRGSHYVNWLDAREGLLLLSKTEDLLDDVFARTHVQGVRAFFSASIGLYDEASAILQTPLKLAPTLGHASLTRINSMTAAILTAAGGNPNQAVSQLEAISTQSYQEGVTQFGVYAEELLAKLFYKDGEKALAEKRLVSAKKARQSSQMTTTAVEAKRISTILR